jgi:hypothetical protein
MAGGGSAANGDERPSSDAPIEETTMKICAKIFLLSLTLTTTALGQGTILWDESVNGELSFDPGTATHLAPLQSGTNSVIGSTESQPDGNNWIVYEDYFTISVSSGFGVTSLPFSASKPVAVWIGTSDFSSQLGYVVNPGNGDLLPKMGLGSIGPGSYGMYLENYDFASSLSVANYRLDFYAQSVPEPNPLALSLLAVGCVAGFLWFRKFLSYPSRCNIPT